MKFRYCYHCGQLTEALRADGYLRAYCRRCDRVLYENPLPSVAMVVTNPIGQILLVRRRIEPALGDWALPGGFIEMDEKPHQAALRELWEETGVRGVVTRLLAVDSHIRGYYGDVLIIAYAVQTKQVSAAPGDDVSEAQFFKPTERPRLAFPIHEQFLKLALQGSAQIVPEEQTTDGEQP